MNWAEWDMSIDVVLQVRRHGGTATACSSIEDGVNGAVTVAHSTAGLPASACGLYSWRRLGSALHCSWLLPHCLSLPLPHCLSFFLHNHSSLLLLLLLHS